jgi:hypothetical protein
MTVTYLTESAGERPPPAPPVSALGAGKLSAGLCLRGLPRAHGKRAAPGAHP